MQPATNSKRPLRLLIVEDSEFDAQMMASLLRKSGYDVSSERVETFESMERCLSAQRWDLILADYNLPTFSAPEALKLLQTTRLDIPFIIVSGGIGEATAVAAMKAGAHDYLMKGNLSRLAPAVERELREAANRSERREARRALRDSELRYRLLWENSPDAVLLMDTDSIIRFCNPAVQSVFGYAPEELNGKSISILQPERLHDHPQLSIAQYLRSGARKKWRATETAGLCKSGAEITIEVSFSDMELEGQRRYVCFIRDVSERKRAELELQENQQQFEVARNIQQRLFPKGPPDLPGYDIAGVTHPADATGGDYFDYLPMPEGHLGLVVADVTGHGVGPALLMAETRAYLRTLAGTNMDLSSVTTRANAILAEDVGQERFVTLFLACLNPQKRLLRYINAAHPTAYLITAEGDVRMELKRTDPPLGILPTTQYGESATVQLEPGDMLLIVTDGIEEATAPDDSLFGVERILEVMRTQRKRSAREILEALYQAVREFSQNQPQVDDVTALLMKILPDPGATKS